MKDEFTDNLKINNPIKLVIWDMDNTFWNGTISEEEIVPVSDNIEILYDLMNRGIVNGIVSKNEYDVVEKKLSELEVSDNFVFKIINWEPKGPQIREKIQAYGLQEKNVLFIDDSVLNLNEALYYCPELNVSGPEILTDKRILNLECFRGKQDFDHNQHKRYEILEKKLKNKQLFETDEDFLNQSNIRVSLNLDCSNQIDRIYELIHKTNQLNYTKKRITIEELKDIIANKDYQCGYVSVEDKYGDYGIVGFWACTRDHLEHFLFSCRIIGMGVEKWVYSKLGCPDVAVKGKVASDIYGKKIPEWINKNDAGKINRIIIKQNNKHILVKGGCDLSQMLSYLEFESIDTEFNTLSHHNDHSMFLRGSFEYSDSDKEFLVSHFPFLGRNTYDTKMFAGEYDIVIWSLLMDYSENVYQVKCKPKLKIAYGDFLLPYIIDGDFERDNLDEQYYRNELISLGRISDDEFLDNLEAVVDKLGEKTKLILINGCEVKSTNPLEADNDRAGVQKHFNRLVDSFIQAHKNVFVLDMRKIISKSDDLNEHIRHYKRYVYYKMAIEFERLWKECLNN